MDDRTAREIAQRAAFRAGRLALARSGQPGYLKWRGRRDLIVGAALEVQDMILSVLREEVASLAPKPAAQTQVASSDPSKPVPPPSDPAASSPRRAAWMAEQQRKEEQRKAPLSRRELLRGRDRDEGSS